MRGNFTVEMIEVACDPTAQLNIFRQAFNPQHIRRVSNRSCSNSFRLRHQLATEYREQKLNIYQYYDLKSPELCGF